MENLESIKNKLILAIQTSTDKNLLFKIWDLINNEIPAVNEPPSFYETEKPMTDAEVDEYFKEEKVELPNQILEILKKSEEDVKNGKVYSHDEVKTYFDEWLKD